MSRRHPATAVLAAALAISLAPALCAQRSGRNGGRPAPAAVALEQFTFAEKSFHSEAVGQDVPYAIYLPKAYDAPDQKNTRWPLVIWLHGLLEDHLRFQIRGGAPVLDETVKDGKLPPCVFVCPNGGRTSMYFNTKEQRWEDMVTHDLLAHLGATYRVSTDRAQRAILGVSMGGSAALRIAFTHPDLFCCVGAHSSAVFPEDPEKLPERFKQYESRLGLDEVFGNPIRKEPWQKANPLCLALALDPAQLHGLRIYFDAGTDDRYGFAAGNELLHAALDKKGIAHTFRLIQGGGHSWGSGFQEQTLPHSFAMVGEAFRAAAGKQKQAGGEKDAPAGKGDGKGASAAGR